MFQNEIKINLLGLKNHSTMLSNFSVARAVAASFTATPAFVPSFSFFVHNFLYGNEKIGCSEDSCFFGTFI